MSNKKFSEFEIDVRDLC